MSQQLIEEYLANGGTITIIKPKKLEKLKPYEATLTPSETPIEFDDNGNRIYKNLNRQFIGQPIDTNTFNYGE